MKTGTYYSRNRDKILAAAKARAAAQTPEDREQARARNREAQRAWAAANPGKIREKYHGRPQWRRNAVQRAKARAAQQGVPFDLDESDIDMPATCPVLGTPLAVGRGDRNSPGPSPCSPSIDRIEPHLGYVKGNVRTISFRANEIKKNATLAELRAIVAYVEAHELVS